MNILCVDWYLVEDMDKFGKMVDLHKEDAKFCIHGVGYCLEVVMSFRA